MNNVPCHVAIIMDGNGRWAKARGLDRLDGHKEGVKSVLACIETAARLGVEYLTLYTFSTENWNRPEAEVNGLMALFVSAIQAYTPRMMEKGVRLKFIGSREGLPDSVISSMKTIEQQTAENKTITVMPAINYGARQEILQAVKNIALDVKQGIISVDDLSMDSISDNLYTAGIPDPDFLIRTSGEMRLSNFLLWQLSYTEFFVTDKYWPEFRSEDFQQALQSYKNRGRRFGGVENAEV
ncbi:MAG: isoprenyl transferase [Lentisphaerales bacterium]|nr:isoprenyl transferase [Lentisphaerales bacterium]